MNPKSNPSNLVIPKGSGGADAGKPLTDDNLVMIGGDVTKAEDVSKVGKLFCNPSVKNLYTPKANIYIYSHRQYLFYPKGI